MRVIWKIIFILLISTVKSSAFQEGSYNFSSEYEIAKSQGYNSRTTLGSLRKFKILLIKSKNVHPHKWNDGHKQFVELLKKNNFLENYDFQVLLTGEEDPAEFAASDIIKAIRDSHKKVLLISSSKASVDTLEALLSYPEVQERVGGFLSFQGAIGGIDEARELKKPVAVESSLRAQKMPLVQVFRFVVDFIESFSSQHSEALYSLKPSLRGMYLSEHDKEIRDLNKVVPTLFVGENEMNFLRHSPYLKLKLNKNTSLNNSDFVLKIISIFQGNGEV